MAHVVMAERLSSSSALVAGPLRLRHAQREVDPDGGGQPETEIRRRRRGCAVPARDQRLQQVNNN